MDKQNGDILNEGFTLIEVLVVIGIIAVLAGIVLVAVNPGRQFRLARDSQRTSNVAAILNAVGQNMAENRGKLKCGSSFVEIPTAASLIKMPTTTANEIDLRTCIVPDYISEIPVDPKDGIFTDGSNYDTRYVIYRDANGRITASSTGEITASISVTR